MVTLNVNLGLTIGGNTFNISVKTQKGILGIVVNFLHLIEKKTQNQLSPSHYMLKLRR